MRILRHGAFFGDSMAPRGVGPFQVACMRPTVPMEEMQVHTRDLKLALSLFRSLDDDDATHGEALALELLDATSAGARSETASRHPPPWLKLAQELIQDRHQQMLGLEEIASEVAVHPVHLTRAFRKFTRQTPGEYHRQCRMEHAMGLLMDSKLSTLDACLAAGYSDQPHFYRCFNAMYGMAPGAFRRITGLLRTRPGP